RRRPGTVGAPTHGDPVGVPVNDLDFLKGNAQFLGDDLGEGGLLSLTVGGSPGEDGYFTRGMDADGGAFPQSPLEADSAGDLRGTQSAQLHVGGEADPQVAPLFACFLLLLAELVVVDHLQGLVQRPVVVAGVVL